MRRFLVTGGCGFIGSNFIRRCLHADPDLSIVNLDLLTYAGNPENLADLDTHPRYRFVRGDIADPAQVRAAAGRDTPDALLNFAAESHVDRSLADAAPFVRTNILGTQVLLDFAKERGIPRYLQVSTDEVYGSLGPTGAFTETTPLAPTSPYAASKAGADLLVLAFGKSFGLPVIITRASNNYGPYQFPEKLIPLMISNAIEDRPLPVYGDGLHVRDWLHVDDHADGILAALERGRPGEVYNIGGGNELPNLTVVRSLLAAVGKPESLIRFVTDRPAHDRRYALDASKARRELGWAPEVAFAEGLSRTVAWYRDHHEWWARVKSGAYREYYARQYGAALASETGACPT
ncbi:MAG: dTDP-glucose 4,6-dehydratase [Planctomycetes bacterium]|nr:dTDP-glucose 4,6-dehydratase [Planctomycetota bacterium]